MGLIIAAGLLLVAGGGAALVWLCRGPGDPEE